MLLLNFSHPITPEQTEQICALLGVPHIEIRTTPTQIDNTQPLAPQIRSIMERSGILQVNLPAEQIIVNLPGLAPAAACVIAEFYRMTERWPRYLRLVPVSAPAQTRYDVAEIIDLQETADF